MQEKTSPVFVMATANRVERLPGEFLRKGRFDEIFFVDLQMQKSAKKSSHTSSSVNEILLALISIN